ncbi:MAG TPA: response regulator [Allosphingosinicella sp.]|uniref:response regulator transcription factor n=1 Tax=Allosphingosinicella sp. TaxID=2823234 RepID=UPI002ED81903
MVHLVDDDEAVRNAVSALLSSAGYEVLTYKLGTELLKKGADLQPGCLLLDIRMPEMSGLELQKALRDDGINLPVVIISGHGDIGQAVSAVKAGAVQFIEKPFKAAKLLSALEEAFSDLEKSSLEQPDSSARAKSALMALTPRERQVLIGMSKGQSNKNIANGLNISPRTVEIHRANLMAKLDVKNSSEALQIAFHAGLHLE